MVVHYYELQCPSILFAPGATPPHPGSYSQDSRKTTGHRRGQSFSPEGGLFVQTLVAHCLKAAYGHPVTPR